MWDYYEIVYEDLDGNEIFQMDDYLEITYI